MTNGKWEITEGIYLPNQESVKKLGKKKAKNTYEYLRWILPNKLGSR